MTDIIDEPDDVAPAAITGPIQRSFAIDDLVVRSEGDGRTVEAYAHAIQTISCGCRTL